MAHVRNTSTQTESLVTPNPMGNYMIASYQSWLVQGLQPKIKHVTSEKPWRGRYNGR